MGLLKHFILPAISLLHVAVLIAAFTKGRMDLPQMFDWPEKEGPDADKLSLWEDHSMGIILGAHMAFLFGCLLGIIHEHSHYRGIITVMEFIYWANGALDAYRLGMPCVFAMIISGVCALGLLVHSQEPGIFTKDHDKAKTK